MVRRGDELSTQLKDNVAGVSIRRNPGVALLWVTRSYEPFREPTGKGIGWLIRVGDPERVEWWAEGRLATRDEVSESVRTGFPLLVEATEMDKGARRDRARRQLDQARIELEVLYPSATVAIGLAGDGSQPRPDSPVEAGADIQEGR